MISGLISLSSLSRKHSELLVFLTWLQHAGAGQPEGPLHGSDQRNPLPSLVLLLWDEDVSCPSLLSNTLAAKKMYKQRGNHCGHCDHCHIAATVTSLTTATTANTVISANFLTTANIATTLTTGKLLNTALTQRPWRANFFNSKNSLN